MILSHRDASLVTQLLSTETIFATVNVQPITMDLIAIELIKRTAQKIAPDLPMLIAWREDAHAGKAM